MKGEKNYEDYINAMEAEDKRYYDDVTTNVQVGESDRLKLQNEYLEKQAEYEGKRRAKSLQEVEDEYKELNVKAMQSYVDGRMNKEEYEESISRLELEALTAYFLKEFKRFVRLCSKLIISEDKQKFHHFIH
jgi:hypothetical protein